MRQSQLFFRAQKEAPRDEVAANAALLIRGHFIAKVMAGVYSFLPLGTMVREKVISIIREEMAALGAEEILMPALHPRSLWDITGRWETMAPVMYQFTDHGKRELGLGPTHEEVVVHLARTAIESYADLPKSLYQIQTKFRDEARPKSGLLRGREFTMKDLYSFHANEESLNIFYEMTKRSYERIFLRCGLVSLITEASGGDFSKEYSHEFQVETDAGEDLIFTCRLCGFSRNKEIARLGKGHACPSCKTGALDETRAVEVGNIFKIGARFSLPAHLTFRDQKGETRPVLMGCYGIGIERLVGTVVETHHDDRGIIWPDALSPFSAHLLTVGEMGKDVIRCAERTYRMLGKAGIDVLYDDRERSPGEKFAEADLIGMPVRLVVSKRTLVENKIEWKTRSEEKTRLVTVQEAVKALQSKPKRARSVASVRG